MEENVVQQAEQVQWRDWHHAQQGEDLPEGVHKDWGGDQQDTDEGDEIVEWHEGGLVDSIYAIV